MIIFVEHLQSQSQNYCIWIYKIYNKKKATNSNFCRIVVWKIQKSFYRITDASISIRSHWKYVKNLEHLKETYRFCFLESYRWKARLIIHNTPGLVPINLDFRSYARRRPYSTVETVKIKNKMMTHRHKMMNAIQDRVPKHVFFFLSFKRDNKH